MKDEEVKILICKCEPTEIKNKNEPNQIFDC